MANTNISNSSDYVLVWNGESWGYLTQGEWGGTGGDEYLTVRPAPVADFIAPSLDFDVDQLTEEVNRAVQRALTMLRSQVDYLVDGLKAEALAAEKEWIESHPIEYAQLLHEKAVKNLENAKQEAINKNNELTELKHTPEHLTLTSPEMNHYSKSHMGIYRHTCTAYVENTTELSLILGQNGVEALAAYIMAKDNWFDGLTDVTQVNYFNENYKSLKIAAQEIRDNLLNSITNIEKKEKQINEANNNIKAREDDVINTEANLNEAKDNGEYLTSVKFVTDFYKELTKVYGERATSLAKDLEAQVKGKNIKSVEDALKSYDKYKDRINKKISAKDRTAIAKALESLDVKAAANNFKIFSKAFGYVGKAIDFYELLDEFNKATVTDNWRPFFIKAETIGVSTAATAVAAFAFSIILGSPVGILGFALIMAVIGALINDELIEKVNGLIGI